MRGKRHILYIINKLMYPLEFILSCKYKEIGKISRPIFIIGAPRSGSTLLSQILFNKYKFSYINNLSKDLYGCQILSAKIIKQLKKTETTNKLTYESYYGAMSGIDAPHEGGSFWFQWFPRTGILHSSENNFNETKINQIKEKVGIIENYYNAPFFNKNLYITLWIETLIKIFPEALFIVIKRNLLNNAKSLLKGRLDINNDKNKWFSVPPKEYNSIKEKNCYRQVIEQVYYLNKQIDNDLREYTNNCIYVTYEMLCNSTSKTIENIDNFLGLNGFKSQSEFDIKAFKASIPLLSEKDELKINQEYEKFKSKMNE
jgi:hypothetical protein